MLLVSVFDIEDYLIPPDQWDTCGAPEKAIKLVKEGRDDGYPSALANHPDWGWFVLESGQGPCVVWSERGYEWNYQRSSVEVPKEGGAKAT